MFRSRFFWQLFGGYAMLVAVFAVVVGVAVSDWLIDDSMAEIHRSLRAKSALLREIARPALVRGADPQFQDDVKALGSETGVRFTVIAADGTVLADSSRSPSGMDGHLGRPEIRLAMRQGEGSATRHSNTVRREMIYFALAVDPRADSTAPAGYVRAAITMQIVDERLAKIRGAVLLGAVIAALVALLFGLYLARRITTRIGAVTSVAKAITNGDYSRRVLVYPGDELGDLAAAYNTMAEQMENRIHTITEERNTVQGILRSMVEGVVAVDRDEVILHMNAVAGEILEVDPTEVIGRRIWETARVNEIARSLGTSLEVGRIQRTQGRIVRGEEECLLDIRASPLHDSDGAVTGAVVLFHDVTEMRRLEVVRRDFVVNASHELKTPITAIRGFLDTLVEDADMPVATRKRFLRRASDQSDRLASLVTDLLRLSRVESGDAPDPAERIDLRDVARRSVGQFGNVAAEKGLELRAEIGEEPVYVLADPATAGLLIDNFVDNAIKYTPSGGHVVVRVFPDSDQAVAEVADDGIGIDKAHQDRIFERFYRVDKARSREVGGTGLGLAIAKHACGMLRGRLTVKSAPGRGSTFGVRLPLVEG